MDEYLIPTIEHIKALYDEIIPLLTKLKTKEDVINFGKMHHVTMEINYDLAENYNEDEPIECIRCENWGDLDYIYVYLDDSQPMFDVWCDFAGYDFIDGITIEKLEQHYTEAIKMLWFRNETRKEDLKEIINILGRQGVEYIDMINIYGFDSELVEECKLSNQIEE
jgi:hypothetical protein